MDDFNNRQADDNRNTQQPYPPSYYSGQQDGYRQYGPQRQENSQQSGEHSEAYQWNFDSMHQEAATQSAPKKKNRGLRVFATIVGVIALVVVGSFATYGVYVAATGNTIESIMPQAPESSAPQESPALPQVAINDKPAGAVTTTDMGLSNADIFKKVSPSVVGIVSYMGQDYFGNEAQQQGSGIIMSADGYIITNQHVVQGETRIEVVLATGESYDGRVIGGDTQTDLAVIKIEATNLPAAEFGNSDQLEVGERVVAIGNPGGLQFASSLTVGYVSALNRVLSSGEVGYALECIQTDAAINPGNSGGALINTFGQVVGINSAKINATGFEGMGFAIPINDARPIIQDIIDNGKVTGRAMLGVQVTTVDPNEALQARVPMGMRIQSFDEECDLPAKGVKVGDIITHINNVPVYNTSGSADILKDFKPGDTVTISLYRRAPSGRTGSFNVDIKLAAS